MRDPERLDGAEERLSPEARRRAMRDALFRPMHLLVLMVGAIFFAFTLEWWIIPVTLATYAALILLAPRDQMVRNRLLERCQGGPGARPLSSKDRDAPPEQRTRRLPRGETRRKVEAALEVHRRTVFAIEESGEAAQAVLSDAVPKLHLVAERLVDVAEEREKAAGAIRDLKTPAAGASRRKARDADLEDLEKELRAADAGISDASEKLLTLRARVVRVSAESGGAAQDAAAKLNADLDELNLRLDALSSTMSNPEPPNR
jgi:hypothetical protein